MSGQNSPVATAGQDSSKDEVFTGETLGQRTWRRFRRHKLAVVGSFTLCILILISAIGPFFSPEAPFKIDYTSIRVAPNSDYWLGTDAAGRNVLARLILGGRVSLSVGLVAVTISTGIGIILGGLSGYFGGKVDMIIMRITDTVMCFPYLVIVLVLVSVLGPSLFNTMLAIGLLTWPMLARITRGEYLYLREQQFVEADHSLGIKSWRIAFGHLLPNAIGPVIVGATFNMAQAILMEAGLSFLGLGVQLPIPSWGNMLQDAKTLSILEQAPWMWIPPGIMIVLAVLSINFIGDGLRDALDPRSRA
jgi:peptide/nickel transport system permease protein